MNMHAFQTRRTQLVTHHRYHPSQRANSPVAHRNLLSILQSLIIKSWASSNHNAFHVVDTEQNKMHESETSPHQFEKSERHYTPVLGAASAALAESQEVSLVDG